MIGECVCKLKKFLAKFGCVSPPKNLLGVDVGIDCLLTQVLRPKGKHCQQDWPIYAAIQ